MSRADDTAASNAIAIFDACNASGTFDRGALMREMETRNGGRALPKASQRTLAHMVKVYLASKHAKVLK